MRNRRHSTFYPSICTTWPQVLIAQPNFAGVPGIYFFLFSRLSAERYSVPVYQDPSVTILRSRVTCEKQFYTIDKEQWELSRVEITYTVVTSTYSSAIHEYMFLHLVQMHHIALHVFDCPRKLLTKLPGHECTARDIARQEDNVKADGVPTKYSNYNIVFTNYRDSLDLRPRIMHICNPNGNNKNTRVIAMYEKRCEWYSHCFFPFSLPPSNISVARSYQRVLRGATVRQWRAL